MPLARLHNAASRRSPTQAHARDSVCSHADAGAAPDQALAVLLLARTGWLETFPGTGAQRRRGVPLAARVPQRKPWRCGTGPAKGRQTGRNRGLSSSECEG